MGIPGPRSLELDQVESKHKLPLQYYLGFGRAPKAKLYL